MKNCSNCLYWDSTTDFYLPVFVDSQRIGTCRRVLHFDTALDVEFTDSQYIATRKEKVEYVTAYACDYESYMAFLRTLSAHYCSMHTPREA